MAPPPPSPSEARAAFFRAFPTIGIAIFVTAIDQTITATALPAIAAQFGVVERMSWVVVTYLIAATIAAPIFGRLGDAYGRRPMLFIAFILQALGMLAAGLAPNFEALLAARTLHGFGGGALLTLAMALIGEAVPARERGRYQAWLVACFMGASAAGPLAGGWLTQNFGWRWVFLAGLPLVALGFAMAWRLPRRGLMGGHFRFDAAGTALFSLFVIMLLLMLDRAQRMNTADATVALGFAVAGGLALWALLLVERRVPDPLLPLPVLTDPVIWRTNLLAACVSGTMVSLISFLPLYLTMVRDVPIATVGAMLLPMSLGGGTGALISGTFLARTGRNMLLPSLGLVLATAVLCVMAFGAGRISLAWFPWLLALSSLGFGCTFPAVQTTVQVAAGAARLGVATASVQFMRNLGAAAGTAVLGALIFIGFALASPDVAERFAAAMRGGREALANLPASERAVMAEGLSAGFRAMFAGAAVMTGVAAVLAFRVPLRRV